MPTEDDTRGPTTAYDYETWLPTKTKPGRLLCGAGIATNGETSRGPSAFGAPQLRRAALEKHALPPSEARSVTTGLC
jgi:hypothetical protein